MLQPVIQKNDRKARILIIAVSTIIFLAIVMLDRHILSPEWPFDFDVHIFATINAIVNSLVFLLLILAVVMVKKRKYQLHKNLMLSAMALSVIFLVSYIMHHLFAGDTKYDGEGAIRYLYYFILITHIILAAVILPFILFTAYRGLTGEYARHKKIARWTWPLWLYISLTGVLVYLMISPYYT